MTETTTIQITTETRDELRAIGEVGEDYNRVIKMLIEEHKEHAAKQNLEEDIEKWEKLIKEHPEQFVSIDEL